MPPIPKPTDREADIFSALEPFTRLELALDPNEAPLFRSDDEKRRELLAQLRAGELEELTVPIVATTELERPRPLPYNQRKKATANFTRFRLEEFPDFAASFADAPFLRDHSSRSTDSGGRILTSIADNRGRTHLIRQELLLVKRWAMEDALDGTMRAFSIGWSPRERGWQGFVESAWCTVCDGPMFGSGTNCLHWPGDVVKLGDPGKRFIVELEWRNVVGRETSEVTFPAAGGTGIEGSIRALAQLSEAVPELRKPQKDSPMDETLRAALELSEGATVKDAVAAIAKIRERAATAEAARSEAQLEREKADNKLAELKAKHATERKAAAKRAATAELEAAKARGLIDGSELGQEREAMFLELAETDPEKGQRYLGTLSPINPAGAEMQTKGAKRGTTSRLTKSEREWCKRQGLTEEEFIKYNELDADESDDESEEG